MSNEKFKLPTIHEVRALSDASDFEAMRKILSHVLTEKNIYFTCRFVPFSLSRNRKENATLYQHSLNWIVTMYIGGDKTLLDSQDRKRRKVLENFDWSQGIAYTHTCKRVKGKLHNDTDAQRAIIAECEQGKKMKTLAWSGVPTPVGKLDDPDPVDLISCLIRDTDVFNYESFKDWAESLGFSDDSIKAKQIYDTCLYQSLKVKNMFSNEEMEVLYELACSL